jgi:hypothetical protein
MTAATDGYMPSCRAERNSTSDMGIPFGSTGGAFETPWSVEWYAIWAIQ